MNKKLTLVALSIFTIAGGFALGGQSTYMRLKGEVERIENACPRPERFSAFTFGPNERPRCGPTSEQYRAVDRADAIRTNGFIIAIGVVVVWVLLLLLQRAAPTVRKGAKVGGRIAVDAGRIAVDELSKRSARATKDVVGAVAQISDNAQGRTRECPFCAEMIKPQAKVCRHCGKDVA
jgi:hypothetical protein